MNMVKRKNYVIRSIGMMNYLYSKGFRMVKIEKCRENPDFNVFIFEDTDELRLCMKEYTDITKKKRG